MNEHLNIPVAVQGMLTAIDKTPLNLGELQIEPHPKFSMFERYLRIIGLDTNALTEFAMIKYVQILKNKETGEELLIQLPTPEWVIYKDTWSYLRDPKTNQPIEVPLKEGEGTDKVKVYSYHYMLFLMRNGVSLIPILQGYLPAFVAEKLPQLNEL